MRGSIRKRGKRSWRIVIDIGRDHKGKRTQKTFTVRGTKSAAETELTRVLAELDSGGFVEPSKLTVQAYLENWLCRVAPSVRSNTLLRYQGICSNHLVPTLGQIKLQKLRPLDIQGAYATWAKSGNRRAKNESGLSKRTILHHHTVLKTALKQAVSWKLIPYNPADAVRPPKPDNREIEFLNKSETAVLIKAVEGTAVYSIVMLALTTGMRLGEVLALRWCDTHLKEGEGFLSVSRSLAKSTDGWGFKEPKSRSGRRRITLPQLTLKALSEHRQWQDNQWRALHDLPVISGDAVVPLPGREFAYPADGLVFSAEAGEVLSPNAVSKAFAKLVGQLNIKQVTFHGLRHTHITHLLMGNVPINVVAERAGHAKVSHTLDLYGHVLPHMQEGAAMLIDQELAKALREHERNEN